MNYLSVFLLTMLSLNLYASPINCKNLSHVWSENDYKKEVIVTDGCDGFWRIQVIKSSGQERSREYFFTSNQWRTISHRTDPGAEDKISERWFWNKKGTILIRDYIRESHSDGELHPNIPYARSLSQLSETYSLENNHIVKKSHWFYRADRNDNTDTKSRNYTNTYPRF